MSVDVERQFYCVLLGQWLWFGPILMIIAMIFLILQIGYSAFACVGVIILWAWFQDYIGDLTGKTRGQMVKLTSERTKLTNELLQGIRVVKLYAWERPSIQRIDAVRISETKLLFKYLLCKMTLAVTA